MAKKKSKEYSSEDGSYAASYDGGEPDRLFSSWGNSCCPSFQRMILLGIAVTFTVVSLYQGAQAGEIRDRFIAGGDDSLGRSETESRKFNELVNQLNSASRPVINWGEVAAVFGIGAGIAGIWHVLKWNVASRHAANAALFVATGLQLIALGYFSYQTDKDIEDRSSVSDQKRTLELDDAILGIGSAAIINSVLGLVALFFYQFFAVDFMSAEGQTNCCDNMGCGASNDCGFCSMCGCSGGRIVTFIAAGLTLAFAIVKAGTYAAIVGDQLQPTPPPTVRNKVGPILLSNYGNAIYLNLAVPTVFLLHGLVWTVNTQTIGLIFGFLGIVNEAWSFSYATKFLAEGKAKIYNSSGAKVDEKKNDEQYELLASMAIISLVATAISWVVVWFFSDEFRKHDINEDDSEDDEPECCERTFYWASRSMARIIILVLVVLIMVLGVARFSIAKDITVRNLDVKFDPTEKNLKRVPNRNNASDYLNTASTYAGWVGFALSFVGLMHVWFWNRATSVVVGGAFILAFVADLVTAGYGFKMTQLDDEYNKGPMKEDLGSGYITLESFAAIAMVVSAAIVVTSVMFSCGYNKADYGRRRAGWSARSSDADSDDEYTYATADSSED